MVKEAHSDLFQNAYFSFKIPRLPTEYDRSRGQPSPTTDSKGKLTWANELLRCEERTAAYYDERLFCVCELSVNPSSHPSIAYDDFLFLCQSSQITASCAFLTAGTSSYPSKRPGALPRRISSVPLSRARQSSPGIATLSTLAESGPHGASVQDVLPPMTPNPVPSVKGQDEVFALSEGRTVWEGTLAPGTHEVATDGEDRRPVVLDEVVGEAKGEGNLWRAIWTGYIPLSFADLAPVNDLKSNLGITATITLRHQVAGIDQTAGGSQGEITQNASGAPSPELTPQKVSTASLRNQDLLQGLGGADPLPSVRLKYVQDCLFPTFSTVASANSISTKVTLDRPVRGMDDYASAAVLRKSFRCVLPIVSALQVRMRTLPAIPVEEHLDSGAGDVDVAIQQGNESDRGRTLICIEAELGAGTVGEELEYELSELEVLVGGKKRAVSLWAEMEGDGGQFPLTIRRSEQHNFVFKILPLVGQFDEGELGPERIRIEARGKVTESSPSTKAFQTDQFSAIWNSVVDMAALAIPQKTARFDHGLPSGDAMQPSSALPTTAMGSIHPGAFKNAERNTNPFGQADGGVGAELQRDLIISASIVPLGSEQEGEDARKSANDVKTFQSFMLEIIFLNLADEVLKLMVAVCLNQGSAAGSSQTVIPLEADVRLTPLQPRACQVVRLRCMPIGTGILEVPAVEVHDLGRGLSARANFGLKVRAS